MNDSRYGDGADFMNDGSLMYGGDVGLGQMVLGLMAEETPGGPTPGIPEDGESTYLHVRSSSKPPLAKRPYSPPLKLAIED